eukprot:16536_1
MASSNQHQRQSRRLAGLPALSNISSSQPDPSQIQTSDPNEQQQQEVQVANEEEEPQQDNDANDSDNDADNNGRVSANLIPANVADGWLGIDRSQNYVINHNGHIIIDRKESVSQRHDYKWRNDKYHAHKRKIEKHLGYMMSNTRAITMFCATNSERLGQPRNVVTQMYSPILYEERHQDLRLVLGNFCNLIIEEIEERGRLAAETSVSNDDLQVFIYNFRTKIENFGNANLKAAYDQALLRLFAKDTIEEVIETLSQVMENNRNENENENENENDSNDEEKENEND